MKVREHGRVVSLAVVLAIGVRRSGEREALGLGVGPTEDGAFWRQFLRGMAARGLSGVQLVISDAHGGPKGAVLQGASWQQWSRPGTRRVSDGLRPAGPAGRALGHDQRAGKHPACRWMGTTR